MSEFKKVLIAEDSSVIQKLTKKILENQNYKIYPAKNGSQVLEMLSGENFDIILMDINMPVMNGIQCAEKIRALSDKKKSLIPIIAITGNAMNLTMEDFNRVGINDYLQKPLNFDRLVSLVNQYTEK
jgi:two-component system, cell cycle response regulator DivK